MVAHGWNAALGRVGFPGRGIIVVFRPCPGNRRTWTGLYLLQDPSPGCGVASVWHFAGWIAGCDLTGIYARIQQFPECGERISNRSICSGIKGYGQGSESTSQPWTNRVDRRRLLGAILLAVVAGSFFAVSHAIYMGYSGGGFNLRAAWNMLIGPQRAYDSAVTWIRNPEPPDVERMLFMGSGVLITVILTYLKYRFIHLPVHPVALMLQGTYMAQKTVFSVFLTWVYKSLVLNLGGVQLYRKGQPFFIGLLVGYAVATFLSCVVDSLFFFGQGHLVHGF